MRSLLRQAAARLCCPRSIGLNGAAVIVESGPDDVYKHLRLTRDGVHVWLLHIANHRGRWEPTPFPDPLDELVTLIADTFPWTLLRPPLARKVTKNRDVLSRWPWRPRGPVQPEGCPAQPNFEPGRRLLLSLVFERARRSRWGTACD